jgi:hypothetical protein
MDAFSLLTPSELLVAALLPWSGFVKALDSDAFDFIPV